MNCTPGYTDRNDFDVYPVCSVSLTTTLTLHVTTLALGGLSLLVLFVLWIIFFKRLSAKPPLARALLIGAPLEILLLILRPLVGVVRPDLSGTTNLGIALLNNVVMAMAANLGITFIYFQARLLVRSAFGREPKVQNMLSKHAFPICVSIAVIQAFGFLLGALGGYFAPNVIRPRATYYAMLIFVDATCIPFFATLSLMIHHHLKTNAMVNVRRNTLLKHIMFVTMGCIGSAVGTVVGSTLGILDIWPFIFNIVSLTAVGFFMFMSYLLARKPENSTHKKKTSSGTDTSSNATTQIIPNSSMSSTMEQVPSRHVDFAPESSNNHVIEL